jgi:pimeloyl-ACP methyl ester carboxylesterase
LAVLSLPVGQQNAVETLFVKVAPNARVPGRSAGQDRAVVLIHGLSVTLSKDKAARPILRTWQKPESHLVKALAGDSDVYSFAYGQTVACHRVSDTPLLLQHLRNLKKAGYREIVLVGHSAGGVVARHLVEDHANLGVTKVVQVCTPNAGSGWASLKTARAVQAAFLSSLTHISRERILQVRKDKRIPRAIQFACVVGYSRLGVNGDTVVSCKSQWSPELREQGVPAYGLRATHWDAVRTVRGAELIARLVKEPQKRWGARTVAEAKKKLLGG